MNYLLDTHAMLWTLQSPDKLSSAVREAMKLPTNTFWVSVISYWEISLKFSLEKLDLKKLSPIDLLEGARQSGFQDLNLDCNLVASYFQLPKLPHNDPFDRLIIWQAIQNKYILISKDKSFSKYKKFGLSLLW